MDSDWFGTEWSKWTALLLIWCSPMRRHASQNAAQFPHHQLPTTSGVFYSTAGSLMQSWCKDTNLTLIICSFLFFLSFIFLRAANIQKQIFHCRFPLFRWLCIWSDVFQFQGSFFTACASTQISSWCLRRQIIGFQRGPSPVLVSNQQQLNKSGDNGKITVNTKS